MGLPPPPPPGWHVLRRGDCQSSITCLHHGLLLAYTSVPWLSYAPCGRDSCASARSTRKKGLAVLQRHTSPPRHQLKLALEQRLMHCLQAQTISS